MRTLAQANTMIGTMSSDPRLRDSQLVRNVRLGLSRQWVQDPTLLRKLRSLRRPKPPHTIWAHPQAVKALSVKLRALK